MKNTAPYKLNLPYTPEPYKLCEVTGTISGNGYQIAYLPDWKQGDPETTAEQLATARLFVAAPRLMNACRLALVRLEGGSREQQEHNKGVAEVLRNVINAAMGRA